MARKNEIERKYRVHRDLLPELSGGSLLEQGYLGFRPTVRARTEMCESGERHGFLTIKGPGLLGRDEFEYEIPYEEARALLGLSQGAVVRKRRYRMPMEGRPDLQWELDVFEGDNEGLIVAEIELPAEDCDFRRPEWLADEVTLDPAYKNAALSQRPFKTWTR
jgi:adenylate cyclase